jgi:hypothetical protein
MQRVGQDLPQPNGTRVVGELLLAASRKFLHYGKHASGYATATHGLLQSLEMLGLSPDRHRHHVRVPHGDHRQECCTHRRDGWHLVIERQQGCAEIENRLGDLPIRDPDRPACPWTRGVVWSPAHEGSSSWPRTWARKEDAIDSVWAIDRMSPSASSRPPAFSAARSVDL